MRLITYRLHNQERIGALIDQIVIDVQRTCSFYCRTAHLPLPFAVARPAISMAQFLEGGQPALALLRDAAAFVQAESPAHRSDLYPRGICVELGKVELLAPIPAPKKIICVGGNYPGPDQSKNKPEFPILFLKPSSSITGPGSPIRIPPTAHNVAYEVELALIIGKRAKYLDPQNAFSCIAGYTVANDIGDRDLEKRTSQWTSGKLMDTFTPLGPALVTADEIVDAGALDMRTILNGQVVQEGITSQMFFPIPDLISYISSLTTLEPGDVILTGSPKMIGDVPAPALALKPGDKIAVEIEPVGCLENSVVAEQI